MNPIYRTFKESDIKDMVALMAQLGYEHTEESLAHNVEAVQNAGGEIFVAELSGLVCGCVSAILDIRLAEGTNGEIVSLVVNESYRGHGIGKGLVVHAEEWLKECTSSIYIRANVIREEAHLFYTGLGYSLFKTQAVFKKGI